MHWFRMWAEAIDDAKLRILSYEDRWHFVALLCLKAQGVLDEKNDELRRDMICTKFGMDSVELEKTMKRLVTVGLVTPSWHPTNWGKRQFSSDSSAQRTRRWRERHRDVTVTPHIQKQITETEEEKREERFAPPPGLDYESFEKWEKYRAEIGKPLAPASLFAAQRKLVAFGKDQAAVVEQSIANGWHGLFGLKVERGASKASWVPPKSIAELEAEEAARGR